MLRLLDHAGDEVDIDLREAQPLRELIRAPDLRTSVGAAVNLEDVVIEVLHAEAQPRDADLAQHLEFLLAQCARLALESDLLRLVPRQQLLHTVGQVAELILGEVRRCAASKINKVGLAPSDEDLLRVELHLVQHGVDVVADLRRVFVRVHAEIAEVAPLAAERDMHIDAQRRVRLRRLAKRGTVVWHVLRFPERERWVVRDKVVADCGLLFKRRRGLGGFGG